MQDMEDTIPKLLILLEIGLRLKESLGNFCKPILYYVIPWGGSQFFSLQLREGQNFLNTLWGRASISSNESEPPSLPCIHHCLTRITVFVTVKNMFDKPVYMEGSWGAEAISWRGEPNWQCWKLEPPQKAATSWHCHTERYQWKQLTWPPGNQKTKKEGGEGAIIHNEPQWSTVVG